VKGLILEQRKEQLIKCVLQGQWTLGRTLGFVWDCCELWEDSGAYKDPYEELSEKAMAFKRKEDDGSAYVQALVSTPWVMHALDIAFWRYEHSASLSKPWGLDQLNWERLY
jgi:hypothetical protein